MADKKISEFQVATTLKDTDKVILNIDNSWYQINYATFKNLLSTTLTAEQLNKINSVIIAGGGNRFATDNGTYRELNITDLPDTVLNLDSLYTTTGNGISISKNIDNNQAIFKLNIDNTYVVGKTYTVGWWFIHDGSLYQCNTEHVATETFDLTKWTKKIGGTSSDTMLKSVYDTNGDGIVDNAEKVNGLTVETAVPLNAIFTDTVTTVEDVLTSTSATNALSANQGKVLNDKVTNIENGIVKTNAQKIQGISISATAPTANQALLYNQVNSQYEPTTITVDVPVASTDVSGTVKIDGTTITIENGVISAATENGIKKWVSGTSYLVDDLVINSNSLWQCVTANSDITWTPANWNCVSTGADGINAYCWIKYSVEQPTQDSDITDVPSNWIGFYSGTSATAPTTYTSYQWFNYKGLKGDTGTVWYTGTAITGNSTTPTVFTTGITNATVNDYYLNISTNYYYQCTLGGNDTVATWIYIGHFDGLTLNDTTISESTTYSSTKIESRLDAKANKSTILNVTVLATEWVGSTAPYTNIITVNGVTTTNNVEVIPQTSLTVEQETALSGARIINGTQDVNSITLKAFGTKPSIDIPLSFIVRGDL